MTLSDDKIETVQPILEDILPSPEARAAFEEKSAALEAAELVRAFRRKTLAVDGTVGISQEELARRIGTSQARVSQIEKGEGRDGPSYSVLRRIAYACGFDWTAAIQFIVTGVSSSLPAATPAAPVEMVADVVDNVSATTLVAGSGNETVTRAAVGSDFITDFVAGAGNETLTGYSDALVTGSGNVTIHGETGGGELAFDGAGGDDLDLPTTSLPFPLQVDRSMRGVARVGAWVDELAILLNLSQRTEYTLRVCLEEAVTNIVTHAKPMPGEDSEKVGLRLIAKQNEIYVTLQYQCEEYDPLQTCNIGVIQKVRGEGSLGPGMLRQVTWSRVGSVNRLMLTMALEDQDMIHSFKAGAAMPPAVPPPASVALAASRRATVETRLDLPAKFVSAIKQIAEDHHPSRAAVPAAVPPPASVALAASRRATVETRLDLPAKFVSAINQIAEDHNPSRSPFFQHLRDLPPAIARDPLLLGQIHLIYQAAMHATRAAVYFLPHLDSPAMRKRKLQIFIDDDGLPGGDTHHYQLTRAFEHMGAKLLLNDEDFGEATELCRHLDPETSRFVQLAAALYARSLGPWCAVEVMSDSWMRTLAGSLSAHFPDVPKEPYFADCFSQGVQERHAEESLEVTATVLQSRPELYSETVLDAKLMAEALDGIWRRLDTIIKLAEQKGRTQQDAWVDRTEPPRQGRAQEFI